MTLMGRLTRTTGSIAAVLLVVMALIASPSVAQDSTPTADQPVVVDGTEITWTGEWEYDEEDSYSVASVPEQAIFFQKDEEISEQIGYVELLTHGVLEEGTAANASEAVDVFAELFLEGASPNAIERGATGELEDGTAWGVYTFTPSAADDIQGQSVSSLITASPSGDGGFTVTSLTAPNDLFEDAITQVQEDFTVDGDDGFFMGIAAEEVAADLPEQVSPGASRESTPVASPEISVLESTPVASPGDIPAPSPEATPLGGAEATLAAQQNLAETETPADNLESTPTD